jgi:hypothetical protein
MTQSQVLVPKKPEKHSEYALGVGIDLREP